MKKTAKIVCGVLGAGLLLTGCATVGNIKNNNPELIYNGNSAVMVDDYLYYGNAYTDSSAFTKDGDYKSAATISYLSRLNTNIEKLTAKNKDYSPKNVEKVAGEVAGYDKDNMFVLGNYIYYATPNRQRVTNDDGNAELNYTYTSFFRSKLNGDNKEKFYTTVGEVTNFEVVKFDGKYYMVMQAGTNLIKIQIGNKIGKAQVLAKDVTSIAIPKTYQQDRIGSTLDDWNGYIFYTTEKSDEANPDLNGSIVHRVSVKGGESEVVLNNTQDVTIKFVGRERDVVFYSKTVSGSLVEIFTSDVSGGKNSFKETSARFYSDSAISKLTLTGNNNGLVYGYTFLNSSNELVYAPSGKSAVKVKFQNAGAEVTGYQLLFVSGRTVYISTTTNIFCADLSNMSATGEVNCDTIVTMKAIIDKPLYAYDGTYIYYYAQLEEVEEEDEDEEVVVEEADENYYLYRTKAVPNNGADARDPYQLLGLVKGQNRRTK